MADEINIDEKLAEAVRTYLVFYDIFDKDCKHRNKKDLAWQDVAITLGLPTVNILFFIYQTDVTSFCPSHFLLFGVRISILLGFVLWLVLWLRLFLVKVRQRNFWTLERNH